MYLMDFGAVAQSGVTESYEGVKFPWKDIEMSDDRMRIFCHFTTVV